MSGLRIEKFSANLKEFTMHFIIHFELNIYAKIQDCKTYASSYSLTFGE